jgi:hypothetical protein
MISTLRSVGWIRQVPVYLREHPPDVTATWTDLRSRVSHAWNSEEDTGLIERYRSWRPGETEEGDTVPDRPEPASEPPREKIEPELPAPEDLDTLEWFDTDDILDE